MQTDILKSQLEKRYDLKIKDIVPAPRGFVAETYYIDTDSERLFLKIRNNTSDNYKKSLTALSSMNSNHKHKIPELFRTIDNEVGFTLEDDRYASLFKLVPGDLSSTYDATQLAKILVNIHKQTSNISNIEKEIFDISYHNKYEKFLVEAVATGYEPVKQLQKDHLDEFHKLHEELVRLSNTLKQDNFPYYITHGDAHNNVMVDNADHYLVDWDSILLAPLERDIWFFVDNQKVMDVYREAFPGLEINDEIVRFYRLARLFSDLNGFLEAIRDARDEKVKDENFRMLEDSVFKWLMPFL